MVIVNPSIQIISNSFQKDINYNRDNFLNIKKEKIHSNNKEQEPMTENKFIPLYENLEQFTSKKSEVRINSEEDTLLSPNMVKIDDNFDEKLNKKDNELPPEWKKLQEVIKDKWKKENLFLSD